MVDERHVEGLIRPGISKIGWCMNGVRRVPPSLRISNREEDIVRNDNAGQTRDCDFDG